MGLTSPRPYVYTLVGSPLPIGAVIIFVFCVECTITHGATANKENWEMSNLMCFLVSDDLVMNNYQATARYHGGDNDTINSGHNCASCNSRGGQVCDSVDAAKCVPPPCVAEAGGVSVLHGGLPG